MQKYYTMDREELPDGGEGIGSYGVMSKEKNGALKGRRKKKKEIRKKVLTKVERWDIVLLLPAMNENAAEKKIKKVLTNKRVCDILFKVSLFKKSKLNLYGEVSEWFKELVLKTSDSERGRGFESHSLRQFHKTVFYHESIWRSTQVVEGVRLESG